MSGESTGKTFFIAAALCVICSVVVSGAAISLKSRQEENKRKDIQKNILNAAGIEFTKETIDEAFSQIRVKMIKLETGEVADEYSSRGFDLKKARKDPELNYEIPEDKDINGIKVRTKVTPVYFVENHGDIKKVILPVYGKGLWSTLYGFLALDKDINTIEGLTFYEHGETPGLGGEVDNPAWKEKWVGKKLFNKNGIPMIKVVKGIVDSDSKHSVHSVDGLSGATITSNGVTGLLLYWISENGYGPLLSRLKNEGMY